jgi:hypothetical protein
MKGDFRLQNVAFSQDQHIDENGTLVDKKCCFYAPTLEEAKSEANRRIQLFINNLRFQLWRPDDMSIDWMGPPRPPSV